MGVFTRHKIWTVVSVCVALALLLILLLVAAPANFPSGKVFEVSAGETAPEIVQNLKENSLIAHPLFLRILLRINGSGSRVQAGMYLFTKPENLLTIAHRLATGAYGIPNARITFIEGTTVREYAKQIAGVLPSVTEADFTAAAKQYEGYLFPDTYNFAPGATSNSIIDTLRSNFNTKTDPLATEIAASGHSLSDLVILASLVEKEARTTLHRKLVAGVLWNRLRARMPLQVDAVFGYIYNRDTYSPSFADLKVDSPYNTYLHRGLPPGPIDNPSLDSIEAALDPTVSKYLYYLTDKNGVMHYATTYADQLTNQRKYLK